MKRWDVGLAVVLFIGALVVFQYAGRVEDRTNAVKGCERGILDRRANVAGWETAWMARRAAAERETGAARANDTRAAERYARIVKDLRRRIDAPYDCSRNYPRPALLPFL